MCVCRGGIGDGDERAAYHDLWGGLYSGGVKRCLLETGLEEVAYGV